MNDCEGGSARDRSSIHFDWVRTAPTMHDECAYATSGKIAFEHYLTGIRATMRDAYIRRTVRGHRAACTARPGAVAIEARSSRTRTML
jgi:hypothetical protein